MKPRVGFQELVSFGLDFGLDLLDQDVSGIDILLLLRHVLNSFVKVWSHFEKNPNHRGKSISQLLFLLELVDVFLWFLLVINFWWVSWLSLLLVVFGFLPYDALFLFNKHLLKLINNIVVVNVTFLFFFISWLIFNKDTIGIIKSAFFVRPSSKLIILEKEIVALKFESNWDSVGIELFDELFLPSGVWFLTGFHEISSSVW